jgi:hypothetical protein
MYLEWRVIYCYTKFLSLRITKLLPAGILTAFTHRIDIEADSLLSMHPEGGFART